MYVDGNHMKPGPAHDLHNAWRASRNGTVAPVTASRSVTTTLVALLAVLLLAVLLRLPILTLLVVVVVVLLHRTATQAGRGAGR